MNLKTGEKKTVTETYSVPDFSEIDLLLEKYTSNDKESDTKEQNEPFPKFEISMKEKKVSREIEIEKNIGKIMCAAVNFMWEEEFDASKKETISWYVPCAELIEKMNLQYGECDGAFYDTMNNVVAFDTAVPFELTTKEDRMRTCYMQACLAYVNFEGISNSDIRKIFGLGEKEKAKASRLLTSAVEGGYIKVMDPDTAPRYKKYIPYWA